MVIVYHFFSFVNTLFKAIMRIHTYTGVGNYLQIKHYILQRVPILACKTVKSSNFLSIYVHIDMLFMCTECINSNLSNCRSLVMLTLCCKQQLKPSHELVYNCIHEYINYSI